MYSRTIVLLSTHTQGTHFMNAALAERWPAITMVATLPTDPEAVTTLAETEEILVPEQFFTAAAHWQISWTPERRLLLAVLEDAAVMFIRYRNDHTTRGKRLFRETREWFASTDRTSLCAFETICDHLNMDAAYLRLGLRRLPTPNVAPAMPLHRLVRRPQLSKRHFAAIPAPERS
jgi:hypothetical protein